MTNKVTALKASEPDLMAGSLSAEKDLFPAIQAQFHEPRDFNSARQNLSKKRAQVKRKLFPETPEIKAMRSLSRQD